MRSDAYRLSVREAARRSGVSRQALTADIKSGRLSAERSGRAFRVELSELARLYPSAISAPADGPGVSDPPAFDPGLELRAAVAEARVVDLEARLRREEETVADLRERLDRADSRILALLPVPSAGLGVRLREALSRWTR